MLTEAQRQEYIARGYDIIFERNNQVFVVDSKGVASWDNEKKEKFCNATGLEIFFEEDENPVFYEPEHFEVDRSILHYIGLITKNIPQPINCRCMHSMFANGHLEALDLSDWDVDGFSIERMLADKMISITTRKRFRRTKDIYDFYAITNFFDVDMQKLYSYIGLRGGAEWNNIPFDDTVLVEYEKAWNKLDLYSFSDDFVIDKPNFVDVLNRFYEFAIPFKRGICNFRWEHKDGRRISI